MIFWIPAGAGIDRRPAGSFRPPVRFPRRRGDRPRQGSSANYASVEFGPTRGETVGLRNYIHLEYLRRPTSDDCIYHVVEHIFRSRFYPVRDHGFIISAGLCENDQAFYQKQRIDILASFEELDQPTRRLPA